MDFIKTFSNTDWDYYGEQTVVPLFINNLSTSYLTKQASYIIDTAKAMPKEAGHSYIRVIAMGAGEYYSSNANGDFFEEKELQKSHDTFQKIAHVFRHHNNKDPKKSYGKPVISWFNPDMHRVELILKIANSKNRDILERLEAGEDVPVSMAAKVKYDICSICQNKAHSFEEHCAHLKQNMNKLAADGRKVFAYNPNPLFFDISFVTTPADKIAYTLEKIASQEAPAVDLSMLNRTQVSRSFFEKISLIKKLSDIEKRIEGVIKSDAEDKDEDEETKKEIEVKTQGLPQEEIDLDEIPEEKKDKLVGLAKKHAIMFEPEEFLKLTGIDDTDLISRVKQMLPGGFSRLLEMMPDKLEDMFDVFEESTEEKDVEGTDDLVKSKSFKPDKIRGRIIVMSITNMPSKREKIEKIKEKAADTVALNLANLYNIYKLTVIKKAEEFSTVLQNYYQLIEN